MSTPNIASILSAMNIRFGHTGSTGNVPVECPLAKSRHSSGTDSSLSLSVKDEWPYPLKCHACGYTGTISSLIAELRNELPNQVPFEVTILPPPIRDRDRAPPQTQVNEYFVQKNRLETPVPYLTHRGITGEQCKKWELGWDERRRRILFPIRDRAGALQGLSGRLIRKSKIAPKYLLYSGSKRGGVLYGEQFLDRRNRTVILVEGFFDVFHLNNLGYSNVLGLMSIEPTPAQIHKLASWFDNILIVPDFDDGGNSLRTIQRYATPFSAHFGKRIGVVGTVANTQFISRLLYTNDWVANDYRFVPISIVAGKDPADLTHDEAQIAFSYIYWFDQQNKRR